MDSILNMSELQLNDYIPKFREINIYDNIVEPIIREFQSIAKLKNIELKCESPSVNTMIKCDEFSVKQIIENLIDNAIKFTEKGWISIRLNINSYNRLVFEVEDTGIGISEEFIPQIFDIFSQEEHGYSRKYEGNG